MNMMIFKGDYEMNINTISKKGEEQEKIAILQQMIDNSKKIVFFGGAGVSTDSGIPDFRSKDGLYNQSYKYPPEFMLSHTCFKRMPEEFFRFYNDKILNCVDCKPNYTHKFLAKLEEKGKLLSVITQNIDGLHEKSGTKNLRLLHGTIWKNYCTKCGKFFSVHEVKGKDIPRCDKCNGIIKPDVVLYEESLDGDVLQQAANDISRCDMLIVGGTSLTVYPAAAFIDFYNGKNLVVINRDPTAKDDSAALVIHGSLSEVFRKINIGCDIE